MKRFLSFALLAVFVAVAAGSCQKVPVVLSAPVITGAVPTSNSVKVDWNSVNQATGYGVQIRNAGGDWSNSTTVTATTVTLEGLTPKTDYEVRVSARGGEGTEESDFSAPYAFTTLEAAPTKLETPSITSVTPAAKGAEIVCTEVAGATQYLFQLRPAGGEWADYGASGTPAIVFDLLTPKTDYEVRVKAAGGGMEDSDYSEAFAFTTTEMVFNYPLTIDNVEDFVIWINEKAGACQPGETTTLAADLDLAGVELIPVLNYLGTFDGGGKTLKNAKLSNAIFASVDENGVVKNLNVDAGSSIDWTAEIEDMTGIAFIASKNNGQVINCSAAGNIKVSTATAGRIYCAGIVGESELGYVEGCKFTGSIDVELSGTSASCSAIAGVVGRIGNKERAGQVIARDCVNEGKIKFLFSGPSQGMKKFGIGGVIGQTPSVKSAPENHGTVENCVNRGDIEWSYPAGGSGSYPALGGVAGIIEGELKGASNYGKVTYTGGKDVAATDASIGGVAGYVTRNASDCHNYGTVTVNSAFAGGTSLAQSGGNTSFSTFGGVFGNAGPYAADATYCGDQGISIENCTNEGELSITSFMVATGGPQMCFGGVVGASSANMKNCHNTKAVTFNTQTKTVNAGGVAGYLEANIENCSNSGAVVVDGRSADHPAAVTTQVYLGGVFGMITKGSSVVSVKNSGAVTLKDVFTTDSVLSYVGGVSGSYKGAITVDGAENSGTVTLDSQNPVCLGGVAGAINGEVKNAKNSGKVVNNTAYVSPYDDGNGGDKLAEIGGLAGYANAVFTGCSNTGDVSSNAPKGFVSGFVGGFGDADAVWTDGSVKCKVTADATKASVLGRFRKASGKTITLSGFSIEGDAASLPIIGTTAGGNSVFMEDLSKNVMNYGGKEYKIVKLADGRWWMAAPLAYVPEGKTVSADPAEDAGIWYPYTISNKVGTADTSRDDAYLYDYATAFGLSSYTEITYGTRAEFQAGTNVGNFRQYEGVQGICPPGWYIPTRADFLKLVGNSNKDDSAGETAAVNDETAVYYDKAAQGSTVVKFNEAGWNFSFLGCRSKTSTAQTGTYNAAAPIDATKCSVEEWYGKPGLSQIMCSTPYMPNVAGNNVQYFCLMTTFTKNYMTGRLNLSYGNYLHGMEVRCIRKAE
ncbi:MAG: fibronectin type III domain-containing protein [Bacteroidales bacterium]|nr:fibronectin type III domain-containing protein [Bacteroidales bacterium]